MRQSHISYAIKQVPSPQLPIRPSQTKAMEKMDTAANVLHIHGPCFNSLTFFA